MYFRSDNRLGSLSAPASHRNLIFFGYSGWDDGNDTGLKERDTSNHLVAQTLKKHLAVRFPSDETFIICAWHKNTFVKELVSPSFTDSKLKIRQIHYVGHGAGGGLYFGYHNKIAADERIRNAALLTTGGFFWLPSRIKRYIALWGDAGLMSGFFTAALGSISLKKIKSQFIPESLMHIWGCFAGAPGHTFDTSNTYWNLFNEVGTPMDGIARHIARALEIQVTAIYDPKNVHGMNYCRKDTAGKVSCPDKRSATIPQWLWPGGKSVRWVTYDASGSGYETKINFLGKTVDASSLPSGRPPSWLTNEISSSFARSKPVTLPSCSATGVPI